MVFILFLICAAAYDPLVKHALHWFQVNSYPTSLQILVHATSSTFACMQTSRMEKEQFRCGSDSGLCTDQLVMSAWEAEV